MCGLQLWTLAPQLLLRWSSSYLPRCSEQKGPAKVVSQTQQCQVAWGAGFSWEHLLFAIAVQGRVGRCVYRLSIAVVKYPMTATEARKSPFQLTVWRYSPCCRGRGDRHLRHLVALYPPEVEMDTDAHLVLIVLQFKDQAIG